MKDNIILSIWQWRHSPSGSMFYTLIEMVHTVKHALLADLFTMFSVCCECLLMVSVYIVKAIVYLIVTCNVRWQTFPHMVEDRWCLIRLMRHSLCFWTSQLLVHCSCYQYYTLRIAAHSWPFVLWHWRRCRVKSRPWSGESVTLSLAYIFVHPWSQRRA